MQLTSFHQYLTMSLTCAVHVCCVCDVRPWWWWWLVSKRYEFQQRASPGKQQRCEMWKNHPKHRNGLTKCKRHVITNQDVKCQTIRQRARMQFVSNFETPSKLFPFHTNTKTFICVNTQTHRVKMRNAVARRCVEWLLNFEIDLVLSSAHTFHLLRLLNMNYPEKNWLKSNMYWWRSRLEHLPSTRAHPVKYIV